MQKRDIDTHRLVKVETATVTDRGPHRSRAAKGGAGARPAGKRLAPDTGHRVDTAKEATGLPLQVGGKERVGNCVQSKGNGLMKTNKAVLSELRQAVDLYAVLATQHNRAMMDRLDERNQIAGRMFNTKKAIDGLIDELERRA